MEPSSPNPLVGNAGDFVHRSPDGRYEIRKAIMVNFPAAAIVNATTLSMACNTASIPGAKFQISQGGGPEMMAWLCERYPVGLPVGDAVASPNFELSNCYHVIHTNAPNYKGRTKGTVPLLRQQLVDCYRRCLEEAYKVGAKSIAFPCLGAGLVLGWRRKDASRIGLNTVRLWFKHPLHGAARRARIPGPIYFLADPVGLYAHQVETWLIAFNGQWPLQEETMLPWNEEGPKTPTMTIRTKKRRHTHNSARRGGAKRGHVTRIHVQTCFNDEETQSQKPEQQLHNDKTLDGEQDQPVVVEPQTENEASKKIPAKRRRIGRRELNSLQEGSTTDDGPEGRSRDRKAPYRYGFDAV
ncbi:hypothetical protein WAI453_005867 [Rhynchosporium graminicola]